MIARLVLAGAVVLLVLSAFLVRRARRRRRRVAPYAWVMAGFASILLAFMLGHAFLIAFETGAAR